MNSQESRRSSERTPNEAFQYSIVGFKKIQGQRVKHGWSPLVGSVKVKHTDAKPQPINYNYINHTDQKQLRMRASAETYETYGSTDSFTAIIPPNKNLMTL